MILCSFYLIGLPRRDGLDDLLFDARPAFFGSRAFLLIRFLVSDATPALQPRQARLRAAQRVEQLVIRFWKRITAFISAEQFVGLKPQRRANAACFLPFARHKIPPALTRKLLLPFAITHHKRILAWQAKHPSGAHRGPPRLAVGNAEFAADTGLGWIALGCFEQGKRAGIALA